MGEGREERVLRKRRKREERDRRRGLRAPNVLIQEFWNVPNMLTMGRIVVIPLFIWFTYDATPRYSLYKWFRGLRS